MVASLGFLVNTEIKFSQLKVKVETPVSRKCICFLLITVKLLSRAAVGHFESLQHLSFKQVFLLSSLLSIAVYLCKCFYYTFF